MTSNVENAGRYRRMAAEIRASAKTITDEETRATMLRLADAYDESANRLERDRDDAPTQK